MWHVARCLEGLARSLSFPLRFLFVCPDSLGIDNQNLMKGKNLRNLRYGEKDWSICVYIDLNSARLLGRLVERDTGSFLEGSVSASHTNMGQCV